MNEHERVNLLENLKKADGTMITIDQILDPKFDVDELVKNVKIVCLCKEGRGRSKIQSEALVKKGRPAIYLRYGVQGLLKLRQESMEKYQRVIKFLVKIPVIVCYMTPDEIEELPASSTVLKELMEGLGPNWKNRYLGGSSFIDGEKRRQYLAPAPNEITKAADEN